MATVTPDAPHPPPQLPEGEHDARAALYAHIKAATSPEEAESWTRILAQMEYLDQVKQTRHARLRLRYVYLLCSLAVLGVGVFLLFNGAVDIGTIVIAVTAGALTYGLYRTDTETEDLTAFRRAFEDRFFRALK